MQLNILDFYNQEELYTKAIQTCIDNVSNAGGGIVYVPQGNYQIGTIYLKNNVKLFLENGSRLFGSINIKDYGHCSLKPEFCNDIGNSFIEWYYALIVAENVENFSICGQGVIDGMGKYGEFFPNIDDSWQTRPFLINLYKCKDVTLCDVTLKDSGMFALFSMQTNNMHIDRVNIRNQYSRNGDGLDFDGGENISISNCNIDSGDDAISPKALINSPIKNLTITNCILKSRWAGIRFGVESSSDMRDIAISNCIFDRCNDGIKMQSCGIGVYENINISNCVMRNVIRPIFMTSNNFRMSKEEGSIIPRNGKIKNIIFSNISINMPNDKFEIEGNGKTMYSQRGICLVGVPHNHIENINLNNIIIEFEGGYNKKINYFLPELLDVFEQYPEISHFEGELPCCGILLRHIKNIQVSNCTFIIRNKDQRPLFFADDVTGIFNQILTSDNCENLLNTHNCKINILSCKTNNKNSISKELFGEDLKNLNLASEQAENYRKYVLKLSKEIDKAEKGTVEVIYKNNELIINNNCYLLTPKLKGKYYIYFTKIAGEFDLYVDEMLIAQHKYEPLYKLTFVYAKEIELQVNSIIKINMKNIRGFIGHHGIYNPQIPIGNHSTINIIKKDKKC
jgi:hypothetical protein